MGQKLARGNEVDHTKRSQNNALIRMGAPFDVGLNDLFDGVAFNQKYVWPNYALFLEFPGV
jgi:hypothetical protein